MGNALKIACNCLLLFGMLCSSALAAPGAYSNPDFAAAKPSNYPRLIPAMRPCPSGGTAADPLAGASFGDPKVAVESLEPQDLGIGQVVAFETEIMVSGSTSPEDGRITLTPRFATQTTSNEAFGFDSAFGVYCAFVDTADTASVGLDGDEKVGSFSTIPGSGFFDGTVNVEGLDDGDTVVVEIWVVLQDALPTVLTGNVQSELFAAATDANPAQNINVGNQTVPLRQVNRFVTNEADLSIQKQDLQDPVEQGSELTYLLTVINNSGNTVANEVMVTDILDLGTTYVSATILNNDPMSTRECTFTAPSEINCDLGFLSPLEVVEIEVRVTVTEAASGAPNGGNGPCTLDSDLCNKVEVFSTTSDSDSTNNNDEEPTAISTREPAGQLTVEKTPATGCERVGAEVVYTYSVSNTGTGDITDIIISDSDSDGDDCVPVFQSGDVNDPLVLDVGETWLYTCKKTLTETNTNVVTVTGVDDSTEQEVSAQDSSSIMVIDPSVSIEKSGDKLKIAAGELVTYSYTVSNTGDSPLSSVVVVDDICPAVVLSGGGNGDGTLDIDEIWTFECSQTLDKDTTNIATVTADDQCNDVVADNARASVDVLPQVSVEKTASPDVVNEPVGIVTYTITVTNTGTAEPITINSLSDDRFGDLLLSCTPTLIGTQLPGLASASCSFTEKVEGMPGIPHTNIVTVTASDDDQNVASDSDDATVTFTNVPSSISVTKEASPIMVPELGMDVSFSVLVTNTSSVGSVTITSIIDDKFGDLSGDCQGIVGSILEPNQSVLCEFVRPISGNSGFIHTNVVTVEGLDNDGDKPSDSDDAVVTVINVQEGDLGVLKTPSTTLVPTGGGQVEFTVDVVNLSSVDSVTITSVTDSIFGDLSSDCSSLISKVLAPLASAQCKFTRLVTGGSASNPHRNVVVVQGVDDDERSVRGEDDAVVNYDNTPVCTDVNIMETQLLVDSNGYEQAEVIRLAGRKLLRLIPTKKIKNLVGQLNFDALRLADANWHIVWTIPSINTQCTNAQACVTSSNVANISSVRDGSGQLQTLTEQVIARLRQAGARGFAKRLLNRAVALHKQNLTLLDSIPSSTTACVG